MTASDARTKSDVAVHSAHAREDLNSEESLERFRTAAKRFNRKYLGTREKAIEQLKREGILTRSGKLSRNYGGK
ncbi:MAG TPA: hypothetical protein PLA85_07835 [Micropepsaceae bacterium]|nr:hypothetical protein [Micropepsaceae bacterium]